MKVIIKTIPHNKQRYETAGDWVFKKGVLRIFVSELGDWRAEMACAFHEFIEATACKNRGIKEEDVSKFDIWTGLDDPGDAPSAPYHEEHTLASAFERFYIESMGMKWKEYNKLYDKL